MIDAVNTAVSAAVQRYGFRRLDLIGYSGGGAVAMLTAARRTDVRRVVTAAGVLDHQVWTRHHRVSPLSGSLNPADAADALAAVRQIHFTGGDDEVVPPGLFKSLLAQMRARGPVEARTLGGGVDHTCCWADRWPRIAGRLGLGLGP
ncbi:MAG: alpha/beta hydrolase [Rhodospirillales bacterium]